MDEQLYFVSPFGLEHVRTTIRYEEGWGWGWGVHALDGVAWHVIDSGFARSDRAALKAVAAVLEHLAAYEEIDQIFEEPF